MMDLEAKSLIEGFLHSTSDRRLRPDRALHHEWLRRRWRPPPGGVEIIVQVEETGRCSGCSHAERGMPAAVAVALPWGRL